MKILKFILPLLVKSNKSHQNLMKNQKNLISQVNKIKTILKMAQNQRRVNMKEKLQQKGNSNELLK